MAVGMETTISAPQHLSTSAPRPLTTSPPRHLGRHLTTSPTSPTSPPHHLPRHLAIGGERVDGGGGWRPPSRHLSTSAPRHLSTSSTSPPLSTLSTSPPRHLATSPQGAFLIRGFRILRRSKALRKGGGAWNSENWAGTVTAPGTGFEARNALGFRGETRDRTRHGCGIRARTFRM